MTVEGDLQARIRLAVGRVPHARLFRNVVAHAWTGKLVAGPDDGVVTLARAQRIKAGLADGSADLIGWTTIVVTPEMVGRRIAVFTSGEVKPPSARTDKARALLQGNWARVVAEAGGRAAVLRSEDDALQLVNTHKGKM